MDEDESVNGTGAACQGGMARGSDAVDKPSNLTFGAEQFIDPASMDEDEGVDGTGANSHLVALSAHRRLRIWLRTLVECSDGRR
jgi:hypothetical protein